MVNLLEELQNRLGLTYIFVAHDLSMVRHISSRMVVMYLGKVMELADRNEIYCVAAPYTPRLCTPCNPDPDKPGTVKGYPEGDIQPAEPPRACNFNTRCPMGP